MADLHSVTVPTDPNRRTWATSAVRAALSRLNSIQIIWWHIGLFDTRHKYQKIIREQLIKTKCPNAFPKKLDTKCTWLSAVPKVHSPPYHPRCLQMVTENRLARSNLLSQKFGKQAYGVNTPPKQAAFVRLKFPRLILLLSVSCAWLHACLRPWNPQRWLVQAPNIDRSAICTPGTLKRWKARKSLRCIHDYQNWNSREMAWSLRESCRVKLQITNVSGVQHNCLAICHVHFWFLWLS